MRPRKIFLCTIALASIIVGALAALLSTKASAETECEKINRLNAPRVAEFKSRHAASSPAVMLRAIQDSDSVELARMKYASLDPAKRKAVWQAKFAQVDLAKYAPARARVIKKTIDLIDALSFDGNDEIKPVRDLEHEIREVFDRDEARGLFASLSASPALMKASTAIGKCNCNQWSDWCLEGYHCSWAPPMITCTVSSWGCGTLWIDPCNGLCV